MQKNIKNISLSFIGLFLTVSFLTTNANAQGTFTCKAISGIRVARCATDSIDCDSDYSPVFPNKQACENYDFFGCPQDPQSCAWNGDICQTEDTRCDFLQESDCLSPCKKTVVKGGGAPGKGAQDPGVCACLLDDPNNDGTVPEGGNCLYDSDCVPTAPYCWAERFQSPTCHTEPAPTDRNEPPADLQAKKICEFAGDQQKECKDCLDAGGILTPLGCIKTNIQEFIRQLLTLAISIGGGIAFIMIVLGGFTMMTSAGNPERLTSGKEIITSAIAGLLLIVFSVVILKIIGVDILQIPGLSK